jgi:uncharacterized protein (TIGR03000 family)
MSCLSSFLITALVAAGSVLASADEAIAQRPGGGRPGGNRPSGAQPNRNRPQQARPQNRPQNRPQVQQARPPSQQYGRQYYRDHDRNDFRDYSRDRRDLSFGIGIGIGGYPFSGYRSNYYAPGYYPDHPDVERYVEPPETVYPEESEPAPVYVEPQERSAETRLHVILPDPDGTVWVDGEQSSLTGESRMYGFPEESGDRMYVHRVKAAFNRDGKLVTEERQVRVRGNATAVVDFTRPADPAAEVPEMPSEENP